jgi:peptidoglycan/LPS O-acetylase OafA/YrhL
MDVAGTAALIALWWLLQPGGQPIWFGQELAPELNHLLPQLVGPWCVLGLLVAAFRGRVWRWFLTRPPIYLIGGMCYTIYLYHPLFKTAVGNVTRHWSLGSSIALHVFAQILLIGCVTFVVSAILFVLIERPFMRPFGRPFGRPSQRPGP